MTVQPRKRLSRPSQPVVVRFRLGAMPVHDVTMNLSHPITVRNVDVEFEVRSDGELQGKVQISKGGIDWTPFKSHPRTATWEQFAAWMEGTA
jgi:hypothetical protein